MIRHILSDVIFLTLDVTTIGTYKRVIFSWANLFGANSIQTTYKVLGEIRQQFFVVQMRSADSKAGTVIMSILDGVIGTKTNEISGKSIIILNHFWLDSYVTGNNKHSF